MSVQSDKNSLASKKWEQVLTKVQRMLDETLATADRRLAELDKTDMAGQAANQRQQREGLDRHLQSAAALVEQTDLALADGEKTVREFLNSGDGLRQRLADWVARPKES